jgi:hypothetical protein
MQALHSAHDSSLFFHIIILMSPCSAFAQRLQELGKTASHQGALGKFKGEVTLIMLMLAMLSNVAAAQSRSNSVTHSPKLVDKTLKLRLRVLKGDTLLTGDEIGATEVAEGSRKRCGEPGQAVVQNKKKKLELKKDGCSADASSAANAATVAVDLSYEDLMTDKESASLATQVIICSIDIISFPNCRNQPMQNEFCSAGHQRLRVQQTMRRPTPNGNRFG